MRLCLAVALTCLALAPVAAYADAEKPTLSVARITSSIQEGQKWGQTTRRGLIGCGFYPADLNWGVGAARLNVRAFEQPVREELKKEGFPIAGDTSDPFSEPAGADWSIGGTITSVSSNFCFWPPEYRDDRVEGSTSIEIDWQLYSNIERRVVAKVHATGAYKTTSQIHGGFETIMFQALGESVKKFAASAEFQQATSKPKGSSASVSRPDNTVGLAGAKIAGPMKIPDAVGSVVLILSGGGHGSGFLVSTDGYVMTAEHVVGSDKYVKVRWSDGLEGLGEVVRTDKKRDAALIKTDPRGRQPLAMRRDAPQPGDTVFAIGAPIDPKLQNTVTRGVVSASNRIMDGFSYIQSDVTVDPGNSGGPLLDEQGRVLGFTDIGIRTKEAPTGLNFFVPIDDALRFLSAEPQ
jgi:S1-C subfamily serine protease